MSFVVAIDGPAGSGKGTVTRKIEQDLGLLNLDTGATYRCVALEVINKNIKIEEENKIEEISENLDLDIVNEDGKNIIILNGEDVTTRIRQMDVTSIVAQVSSIIKVRENLVNIQRKIVEGKDVVVEGRDIGTVVFPNADVKIYLDASPEVRAERRYKENKEKNIECTYEEILKNVNNRDYIDMHKKVGALKKAEDSIVVDSSNLTIDQVVEKIEGIIKEKQNKLITK